MHPGGQFKAEEPRHIHSEAWRKEQVLLAKAAQAARSGELTGIMSVFRTATGPMQERLAASVVNTMIDNIGESGVGTLDGFIKSAIDGKSIGTDNAKEHVMVSLVVLGASFKEKTSAIFPEALKRIQDNLEMPPEIREIAGRAKDTVEYRRYVNVEELFKKIREEKLAGANQKTDSPEGV